MRNKIVKLTESDLVRLVKKVINEQDNFSLDEPIYKFDKQLGMLFLEGARAVKDFDKNKVLVMKGNSEIVKKVLNSLPKTIKMLSFYHCEFADFRNIDLCEFPNLRLVGLIGTPNNFKRNQGGCFGDGDNDLYSRIV